MTTAKTRKGHLPPSLALANNRRAHIYQYDYEITEYSFFKPASQYPILSFLLLDSCLNPLQPYRPSHASCAPQASRSLEGSPPRFPRRQLQLLVPVVTSEGDDIIRNCEIVLPLSRGHVQSKWTRGRLRTIQLDGIGGWLRTKDISIPVLGGTKRSLSCESADPASPDPSH